MNGTLNSEDVAEVVPKSLDESRLYGLLADEHRRAVLAVVNDLEADLSLVELATRLERLDEYDTKPKPSLLIELHHVHLPKLADAGIIEYDAATNTVLTAADGGADA